MFVEISSLTKIERLRVAKLKIIKNDGYCSILI